MLKKRHATATTMGTSGPLVRSQVTWGVIAWTLELYSLDFQLSSTFDCLLPYSGIDWFSPL